MAGVGRHTCTTRSGQLRLKFMVIVVNLQVTLHTKPGRDAANKRSVIGPPVQLGLIEGLPGRMAQTEEEFDQRTVFGRHHIFGRVDLRVLVGKPQGRVRQVDKIAFVLEQFHGRRLPSLGAEGLERFGTGPPQFRNAVVGWLHAATRLGQRRVDRVVERVELYIPMDCQCR